jgi:hypothetical protein
MDTLPTVTVPMSGEGQLTIPAALAASFGVVLLDRSAELPVEHETTAAGTVARHLPSFPIRHSADSPITSVATAPSFNPGPVLPRSTGFVRSRPARPSSPCTPATRSVGCGPTTSSE